MLNMLAVDSNITLYYTHDIDVDSDPDTDPESQQNTLVLNFIGNQVAIFDNDFILLPDADEVNGDENLYLKGGGEGLGGEGFGGGSMAVINLFNGDEEGNSPEFDAFKNDFKEGDEIKRLINEGNG